MAAKRPTGELPKRNSNVAKFIAGNAKTNKLNPAQSRVAAGKYRDEVKKTGAKTMDQTGAALGKAIRQTQKLSAKPAAQNKSGASTVSAVAKRFGVTAREARDIATALGTVAGRAAKGGDATGKGKDIANLKKQIKEVGVAAKTGKKGTTSDIEGRKVEMPKGSGRYTTDRTYGYEKGKKRK